MDSWCLPIATQRHRRQVRSLPGCGFDTKDELRFNGRRVEKQLGAAIRRCLPLLGALALAGCGQGTSKHAAVQGSGHIPAKESDEGSGGATLSAKGCFANPDGCGYPGPNNEGANEEGAAHCPSLSRSGSVTASATGQKVEGMNIMGTVTVAASNVTINNVCVTHNGEAKEGSQAIRLERGANETTISNSTIRGEDESTKSVDQALSNNLGDTGEVASKDYIYNCGECIQYAWTVNDSYVLANGMKNTSDHYEAWYFNNNTISADHDTMLNPYKQTAVLFGNALGEGEKPQACQNHITATNNLFAGGGAMLYPCGNATSVGSSTMTIKNNRFARMKCAKKEFQVPAGRYGEGGWECENGVGTGGYWPRGGFFYVAADFFTGADQLWEGNFWDDNLERVEP